MEHAAGGRSHFVRVPGAVNVNTWYEVDLSSLVTGDGTYSIRIASTSTNGVNYSTKEGAAGSAPQLVVTLGA